MKRPSSIRAPGRQAALFAALMALFGSVARAADESPAPEPADSGRGWSMTRLDLDVTVLPAEERFVYDGTLRVRLDGLAASFGPDLLLNIHSSDGRPGIDYETVSAPGATARIEEDRLAGRIRVASVRFPEPRSRGDEVEVSFRCATGAPVGQLGVSERGAVASWTTMWHPWTVRPTGSGLSWKADDSAVPGKTTLRLPGGWTGIVDGKPVSRESSAGGTVEVWRTPPGIARSFAAGPFEVTTHRAHGRTLRVYELRGEGRTADRVAATLAAAISAEEARFGPFPFAGTYGAVEFPRMPGQSFGAASQQTFILAQPPAFDLEDGNVQLWAHEAAHAWWVNTVGTAGPGRKWCGESLAELGAAVAVEAIEGREAMLRFLDLGRPGMDPYYSAAGYFALLRQGQDRPIATMGGGGSTHALANSKGVWIYHMLRERLGDERFFAVLRGLIRDFAGRDLTADDVRARFVAEQSDLEDFFAQWLDREGAPVLRSDWYATVDGGSVLLRLTQLQAGEPFRLPLEVAIELDDGSTHRETIALGEQEVFEIDTPARPVGVRLDPDRKTLIWRPSYGPRPGAEIVGPEETVPASTREAIVGLYRFREMEKDIRIFERDGAIYAQPEGAGAVRLLPRGDGVFHVDAPGEPLVQEFDLSVSPSPTLRSIEGVAGVFVADRVEDDRP